jgi:hypothetical protein
MRNNAAAGSHALFKEFFFSSSDVFVSISFVWQRGVGVFRLMTATRARNLMRTGTQNGSGFGESSRVIDNEPRAN